MTKILFFCASLLISCILGLIIIPKILLISHKKKLFDLPNKRKVHTTPIPRLGGFTFFPVIQITLSLITGLCFYLDWQCQNVQINTMIFSFCFLTVGGVFLYLVGVKDDLIGVSYRYKFISQIVAALFLVLAGQWIPSLCGLFGIHALSPVFAMLLTVFIVISITNAINLIDGIDGLASGLSCIALGVLAAIFIFKGDFYYVLLSLSTLGVLIPFWFYNVFGNAQRGHKLFMGDAGSLTLGYILSVLVIHLCASDSQTGKVEVSNIVIAFSTLLVPLFDIVRVVLFRLRNHKHPFSPDKNHIHHKLLRSGLGSRGTMICILLIALFFIILNLLLIDYLNVNILVCCDILLWTCLHLFINFLIKRRERILLKTKYLGGRKRVR